MPQMKDTQGVKIPRDQEGEKRLFNIYMFNFNGGKGPELTLNVPKWFTTEVGFYDSRGCVSIPLIKVMEHYLKVMVKEDRGEGSEEFARYLEKYAKRLRKKVR